MRLLPAIVLLGWIGLAPIHAQSAVSPPPAPRGPVADLAAVVVSGVQPGPGLWKVSRSGHVLWVLGTLSPLPQGMQWRSQQLQQVLGSSAELLLQPKLTFKADVGFLGKLFLLPSAYSARKNEDGATLQQILPPPVYARWQLLKQKYIGSDRGVERWRPLFAAQELYRKALKANGLSRTGGVPATVDALARQLQVKQVPTSYQVVIAHPRDALKAFRQSAPRDITCFIRMLDNVQYDMPQITARANAWATGDIPGLRALPDSEWRDACVTALADAGFARTLGLDDLPAKLQAVWVKAALTALRDNPQTLAILPMHELLQPDGYLAALKADGYLVESPDEQDAEPAVEGSSAVPANAGSAAASQ
ncbi:MAG: TraB/GumN family protein [Rhodanobacter sp.]